MSPLVSILMPVRNRNRLVAKAIRSIQQQTCRDWELLILDDASTDQTLDVCKQFAQQDNRIRVYTNKENLGVGKSRNRLVSLASGEFIANHDSDDESVPDRLELQLEVLRNHPEIGLVSGIAAWTDGMGTILGYEPLSLWKGVQYPEDRNDLIRMLFMKCEISNPTLMFRRSLNIPDPYGDYRVGEDWYFFLQVAHRSKIYGIQKILVKMLRGAEHSHLWKDYAEGLQIMLRLRKDLYNRYKNDPSSPINYTLYRKGVSETLTKIGRNRGGIPGCITLFQALLYDPFSNYSWRSLYEFSGRGMKKIRQAVEFKIPRGVQ
jgi:glycosyltransferase involved in cell wall biosynthesis